MATITNHGLVFDSPEEKARYEASQAAMRAADPRYDAACKRFDARDAAMAHAKVNGWANPLTRSLQLRLFPEFLRDQARACYETGDALGFLCLAENTAGMAIVIENAYALKRADMYEACLLDAIVSTRTNNYWVTRKQWTDLFNFADLAQLRAAGDPLPHAGPFTLYRGTHGDRRYVRGVSWTLDLEQAKWFMGRGRGDASNAATKRRQRIGRCPS